MLRNRPSAFTRLTLMGVAVVSAAVLPHWATSNDCTHDRAKKMWCTSAVPQCPSSVTPPDQCSYYQHGQLNKDFFGCGPQIDPEVDTKCDQKETDTEPPQPVLELCYTLYHCIGVGNCSVDLEHPVEGGELYAVVTETKLCNPD